MKVLFILEAGIPEYRNFLLERLATENEISEFLILHTGRIYNGQGNYNSKKVKFVGNNKLGFHIGVGKYIFKYDVVVSSYNLRILTCWLPVFFKNKFIFWGKGLGNNEGRIVKLLRQITANKARYILVYNDAKKKEFLKKIQVPEKKIIAYTNSIYISNPGVKLDTKRDYFLYFGRIQERKGLEQLISQYKVYLDKINDINRKKLRFVGNGEYVDKLKNITQQLKLHDYIEFFPGVYDDQSIKMHFDAAVAYVSPFNVGLSIVNSLAYGVPVITCGKPQVGPEFYYLNKQNSLIMENLHELSDTFLKLSENNNEERYLNCYNYYLNYLDSNIMYKNFLTTIMKTWNE